MGSWEVGSRFGLVSGQLGYWTQGAGHEFDSILLVTRCDIINITFLYLSIRLLVKGVFEPKGTYSTILVPRSSKYFF